MSTKKSFVTNLARRELGESSRHWQGDFKYKKESALEFCNAKVIECSGRQGVTWLDIDHVEQRYMLAACANGSVSIYDVHVPSQVEENVQRHNAIASLDKRSPGGHHYLISSVAWYPVDTGLFVSGSFDAQVNVCDTNQMCVACQFDIHARVYSIAMSPVATTHCLVAVGSEDPLVKLADPVSGAVTHSLQGHRESVWAVHWSLQSDFELVTGGMDGELRLWDIRRSGCIRVFDQHYTQTDEANAKTAKYLESHMPQNTTHQPANAHDGHITAVLPCPNGLYWISAATDSRMRLWDSVKYTNVLVNYPQTYNRSMKARQLGVTDDGQLIFHPSGSVIQVFDLFSGAMCKMLRGHMDTINCCTYNASAQELYSGSNDGSILVWEIPVEQEGSEGMSEDNWSE